MYAMEACLSGCMARMVVRSKVSRSEDGDESEEMGVVFIEEFDDSAWSCRGGGQ
jgi:hypothetical protein